MKKNIFIDNYLLCGGIITGVFTFMGAIPLAIGSAAITGCLIANENNKEKQRQQIQVDRVKEREYKIKYELTSSEEWEIDDIIKYLGRFRENDTNFAMQEKLEKIFENATFYTSICDFSNYARSRYKNYCKLKRIYNSKDFIRLAECVEDNCKFVVANSGYFNHRAANLFATFIIKFKNEFYEYEHHCTYPRYFRKRCQEYGIPVRDYELSELYNAKQDHIRRINEERRIEYERKIRT